MPSKPRQRHPARKPANIAAGRSRAQTAANSHIVFFPLLAVCLLVWLIYRLVFQFPVWFDETIGKALFFGLPVWLYITMTGQQEIADTFAPNKIRPGLLLGVAAGGIYGFAVSILSIFRSGATVAPAPLFSSPDFWGEFILAMLTGFWETLFFYGWVMVVVQTKFKHWDGLKQLMLVSLIFLVFHLPNIVLRTGWGSLASFGPLLFLFALGQALLFWRDRNGYALVMSQAIWGLALLVHLR